jgi:sulfate/thiosulfate transport system substrate-binding protein
LKRRPTLLAVLAAAVAVAAVAGSTAGAARQDSKISIVAYSTPQPAFEQLITAFNNTKAGQGVSFSQSYGASGTQTLAIIAGLHADIVDLSLEPDMQLLVDNKIVAPTWKKNKYNGIVTRSVVAFVVRPGNPKHIRTWDDLVKPGVSVVTPNPFTSGGARWNVLAGYGAMLREGKSKAQAVNYLKDLFKNHIASLDSSARNATNSFASGRGDVLLTYENEAIYANQKGVREDYYIPKATLQIDNPLALTTKPSDPAAARAFYNFLYTPQAQKIFAQNGYRPVVTSVLKQFKFPNRPQKFTIKYLGGWPAVNKKFFDPDDGIMAKIINQK